jgi:hypothetical protein
MLALTDDGCQKHIKRMFFCARPSCQELRPHGGNHGERHHDGYMAAVVTLPWRLPCRCHRGSQGNRHHDCRLGGRHGSRHGAGTAATMAVAMDGNSLAHHLAKQWWAMLLSCKQHYFVALVMLVEVMRAK